MTVKVQFMEVDATIKVNFKEENSFFKVNFGEEDTTFKAVFSEAIEIFKGGSADSLPKYEGPHTVVPKFIEQKLSTAQKIVFENVTIKEIPYSEVSNNSGGITAIIG